MCNQDDCTSVSAAGGVSVLSRLVVSVNTAGNISLLLLPIMEMKGVGVCCCPLFDKFLSEL